MPGGDKGSSKISRGANKWRAYYDVFIFLMYKIIITAYMNNELKACLVHINVDDRYYKIIEVRSLKTTNFIWRLNHDEYNP